MTTYPNPVAFCFMEPHENTGGIIFARSNIEARRIGANKWNDGEIGGCICYRAPLLDKYAGGRETFEAWAREQTLEIGATNAP